MLVGSTDSPDKDQQKSQGETWETWIFDSDGFWDGIHPNYKSAQHY